MMKNQKKYILFGTISIIILGISFFSLNNNINTVVAANGSAVCNVNPSLNNGNFQEEFNHVNNAYYSIDCTEIYTVYFDTPRINYGNLNDAIIAGTAFDYNTSAESIVECELTTKNVTVSYMPVPNLLPVPEPKYDRDSWEVDVWCDDDDDDDDSSSSSSSTPSYTPPAGSFPVPSTGNSDKYQECINLCDGGVGTDSCLTKCDLEIYQNVQKQNSLYNFYNNIENLFNDNFGQSDLLLVGSYKCGTKTEYGPWYQTNAAEIASVIAENVRIQAEIDAANAYNAEVDAFVAAANSKPGVNVTVSGSNSSGAALDWEGIAALPDTLPEDPTPSSTSGVMTIKEDSATKYYSLSGDGVFTIPYKSIIDAVTGEVIELTSGSYPTIPYYELTEEMKTRNNINSDGYNYFTDVYTLTSKLIVNSNGQIGTTNTQTSGISYAQRSISVTVTGGHGGSFDIACGYDILNELFENSGINIMYRPIDMLDVFPNRSARWNWRGEYAEIALSDRTLFNTQESIYSNSNLEYTVNMSTTFIQTLRNLGSDYYNGSAYEFKLICTNTTDISKCKSQLLEKTGSSNITRG